MLTTDSTKVMAAAKASRVFALRVNCRAIGVPRDRGQQQDANPSLGGQREDMDQQKAKGRYQQAIGQQGAHEQGAVPQDIEQLSAPDAQPDGEHRDRNEEVEQRQGPNQHVFLR